MLIIANWKMNPTSEKAALKLVLDIKKQITSYKSNAQSSEIVLCPPAIYLKSISGVLKKSVFNLGAQNCFYEESGTFTGEVSAKMLADLNIKYCIIGHSERKKYFNETIEDVKRKADALIKNNITPVICVGEGYGQTKKLEGVSDQVNSIISGISKTKLEKVVFAYEPAWAISDGKNPVKKLPDHDDILSAKLLIQKCLIQKISKKKLDLVKIIYGGSITSKNVKTFIGDGLMDGVLVGGASLKAKEFGKIIDSVCNINNK